jgi:hypothetical protein
MRVCIDIKQQNLPKNLPCYLRVVTTAYYNRLSLIYPPENVRRTPAMLTSFIVEGIPSLKMLGLP